MNNQSESPVEITPDGDRFKFRTPARRGLADASPDFRFATPDLNLPCSESARTPVMLVSLGIRPGDDPNISWQSCMATPSSAAKVHSTTVYHTPMEDQENKVQMKRCLQFPNEDTGLSHLSPNQSHKPSEAEKSRDLIAKLLKIKSQVAFVYPKPVYIQMKDGASGINTFPILKPAKEESRHEVVYLPENDDVLSKTVEECIGKEVAETALDPEEEPAPSPVVGQCRRAKKKRARKNLHFNENQTGSSVPSQEYGFQNSCSTGTDSLSGETIAVSTPTNLECVLDTVPLTVTAHVGPRTGSRKGMDASPQSLTRAKRIFNESQESTRENNMNSPVKPLLSRPPISSQSSNRTGRNHTRSSHDETESTHKNGFMSFGTASGKIVAVSAQSIGQAQKIFSDYELESELSSSSIGLEAKDGKSVATPAQYVARPGKILRDCEDTNRNESGCSPNVPKVSVGFHTASGKRVSINALAMARANQIFKECQDTDSKETVASPETELNARANELNTLCDDGVPIFEKSLARPNTTFENQEPALNENIGPSRMQPDLNFNNSLVGFSTASGKNVPLSAKSIARANQIFKECQEGNENEAIDSPVLASGSVRTFGPVKFSAASGKNIPLSAKSMARANQIFKECREEIENESFDSLALTAGSAPTTGSAGFSTASGKNIRLSEKSIVRANQIFKECQEAIGNEPIVSSALSSKPVPTTGSVEFSTASGKNVHLSEKSMARANKIFQECQEAMRSEAIDSPASTSGPVRSTGLMGFSTASGKNVAVTEISMTRANQIFKECQEFTQNQTALAPEIDRTPGSVGFITAKGKSIDISAQSMARANQIYKDCQDPFKSETGRPFHLTGSCSSVKDLDSALSESLVPVRSFSNKELSAPLTVDVSSVPRKRKLETSGDSDSDLMPGSPSPTLGSKKKRRQSPASSLQSNDSLPLTQFSVWDADPTCVELEVLTKRRRARGHQLAFIEAKKKGRRGQIVARAGSIYRTRCHDPTRTKKTTIHLDERFLDGSTSLPPLLSAEQLIAKGVMASVCAVNAANAASFIFYGWEYFSLEACRNNDLGFRLSEFQVILADDNTVGCDEISAAFLASAHVDPQLVSADWIRNHYRWIVWKMACLEQRFPETLGRQCLTPANLLEQLKYRYDREIDACQRSALRRITEQDDTPAKTMVLCVAAVSSTSTGTVLELTDGWYAVSAHTDPALKYLVESGRIFVGLKLVISNAELTAPGPSPPLEITTDTYLKLSANSVRRARWSSRLGFLARPQPLIVGLRSILPDGGLVSRVRVLVARIYPLVFMEKNEAGRSMFRSERFHRKASDGSVFEFERQMEKMVDDVERETDLRERQRRRHNGSAGCLSDEERRSSIIAEAQKRMQQVLSSRKKTEAVAVLRLRLVDWRASSDSNSALLSVWRPSDDLLSLVKESRAYGLYNVMAQGLRFGELQLTALKQTRWNEIEDGATQVGHFHRTVTSFQAVYQRGFRPAFNQLDVVGLVVHVVKPPNKNSFQTGVLFDGTSYFGVKCWSGFEDFALEDVIVCGTFLALSNLHWRSNSNTGKLAVAYVGETTIVSSRPAAKHLDQALHHLKLLLTDPMTCVAEAEPLAPQWMAGNGTPVVASTPNPLTLADGRRGSLNTPTDSPVVFNFIGKLV